MRDLTACTLGLETTCVQVLEHLEMAVEKWKALWPRQKFDGHHLEQLYQTANTTEGPGRQLVLGSPGAPSLRNSNLKPAATPKLVQVDKQGRTAVYLAAQNLGCMRLSAIRTKGLHMGDVILQEPSKESLRSITWDPVINNFSLPDSRIAVPGFRRCSGYESFSRLRNGFVDIVQLLCTAGADVNKQA